jgi:hypothetical protein
MASYFGNYANVDVTSKITFSFVDLLELHEFFADEVICCEGMTS